MLDSCRIVAAIAVRITSGMRCVCTLCEDSFTSGVELSEMKNLKVFLGR